MFNEWDWTINGFSIWPDSCRQLSIQWLHSWPIFGYLDILSMFFLSCLGSVPICKRWAKLWSSPQLTLDWGHAGHLSNSGFPIEAAKHRWRIDVHLVGGFNLPLWKIWVSWDDEIPNTVYGKIIQMFQSTNQRYIYIYTFRLAGKSQCLIKHSINRVIPIWTVRWRTCMVIFST